MKHIKIIGLAAVAAMAFMAFVGAGSASATVLCSTNTTPCTSTYGAGQTYTATASNPQLTNSINNIKCTSSSTTLRQNTAGGSGVAVEGEVTALTFTGCAEEAFPRSSCKSPGNTAGNISVENLPYAGRVDWTTEMKGNLTAESGGNGEPRAHVECGSAINCIFGAAQAVLGFAGGNPATITASVPMNLTKNEGFICPSSSTWNATYHTVSPSSVWVASS